MTMLDRCPAWTTENLTALGNDVGQLRMQLDGLLEDLGDAPDARVSYLEAQMAGIAAELARLDGVLDELRLALAEEEHPDQIAADQQTSLAATVGA